MDIQDYFNRLNVESQTIFTETISEKEKLGTLHHLSSCVYEYAECLLDQQEKEILITVSAQLESANLNVVLGLYRQAFSSLRLAFEMGLASMYFSANKLELHEWLDGRSDIKWSSLVDEDNGVLSQRFAKAFFSECSEYSIKYRKKAIAVYRKLSEYVHGNNETWENSGLKLGYNATLFELYCEYFTSVAKVILYAAICRYAKQFDESTRELLQFIPEEFKEVEPIRKLFGQS
ncbi:MAG: hypothetical protein PHU29_10020 [Sulfuricurvum sp.]|uniref:hypothetical protein n=1 Tax=Sulfuricurvum sp. TaxID=2025608 RepID=UPI0026149EB4|nr:hypothetical protein [Sulfuricurvum sp.]MDD2951112.1 hypothetical protein [Sulfuricurvum sp.]MDD5117865.1 hypothetical protein [Sulfuricurvum sp.]